MSRREEWAEVQAWEDREVERMRSRWTLRQQVKALVWVGLAWLVLVGVGVALIWAMQP